LRRALAVLAALALTSGLGAAAEGPTPSVTASASRTEVTLGEVFDVLLRASGPPGTTWSFPSEAGDARVELRTPAPDPKAPAQPAGSHSYAAAAYAIGDDLAVPPVKVGYRLPDGSEGSVLTQEIPLKIRSVLPKDPREQKPADIRGPLALGVGAPFWAALAAAVLLLAGAVTWLVRRLRRRRKLAAAPAEPAAPPDVAALRALERLAASGLVGRGELRAFYIELTEVVKRYLGARLRAAIPEMTTAETLAFLREQPLVKDQLGALREVATAADRVKFARASGLAEEAERHLAWARALVAGLEAQLAPKAASGGEKVA
jgi:hypothetical protein